MILGDKSIIHQDKRYDELSPERQKEVDATSDPCDKWCPKLRSSKSCIEDQE